MTKLTPAEIRESLAQLKLDSNLDLSQAPLMLLGEGMDSVAYLVDAGNQYVFRFPKVPHVSENYEKEARLLPELSAFIHESDGSTPALFLDIPNICFTGKMAGSGLMFIGHELITGISLYEVAGENPEAIKAPDLDRIAQSIAGFIKKLRIFPVTDAIAAGVPDESLESSYIEDHEQIKEVMLTDSRFDRKMCRYVEDLYGRYFSRHADLTEKPVLLHGDLWPEHILLSNNQDQYELSGIIDFGDCRIADPDFELMQIAFDESAPPGLFKKILENLGLTLAGRQGQKLKEKLRFYHEANWIQDIIVGLDRNDPDQVDHAVELVRKQVQLCR